MHFLPILSTLRRHRTSAALIVLEIALTCAIVSNAIFLIGDRLSRMDQPSGVAEDELVRVAVTGLRKPTDAAALTAQDLTALRAIPGVRAVAVSNSVPFGSSIWSNSVSAIPDDPSPAQSAATYMGSGDLVETLGVKLIAGRDFNPDEYVDFQAVQAGQAKVGAVILTRGIAERMFPGKSPIGQPVYIWGSDPQVIVGVIEQLAPAGIVSRANAGSSMLLPLNVTYTVGGNYLLRVDPARRAQVLAEVDAAIEHVDASRIVLDRQTFAQIRESYFKQDSAMAYLLIGVSVALLVVTALGIVGLASFWVQQRTRQIGIRRALGATRGDILRYFQLENFILATIGIVLGMALAYAINFGLMSKHQVDRLPASYLPIGAALLWLLGQLAVLGPALRASTIPPAIATRSV